MAPPRKFNSLASWRNAENSLHSINLTMPRALFAKDIDVLGRRCNLNFVCLSQAEVGRSQQYWISPDLTRQTFYQRHRGPEYARDWERIAAFGELVLAEVERLVSVDAIMTANIDYWQDQGIRMAAQSRGLPFLILRRENECSVVTRVRARKRYSGFKFEGDGVAVFGRPSLEPLIESGACREEQLVVTGAPRLDSWRDTDPLRADADTLVLLSYRDPAYRAPQSFREVLEIFVNCAERACRISEARFVVKAKSNEDAFLVSRMLPSRPRNLSIEHEVGLYDLFSASRLIIGFESLSLVEALLSDAAVAVPFWGSTCVEAEQVMFHSSREEHEKALEFIQSPAALCSLVESVVRNERSKNLADRNARLHVVNQMVAWSPERTASVEVETWIRSAIASDIGSRSARPAH